MDLQLSQSLIDILVQVVIIPIAGFAVSYLKNIGTQTASLSHEFLELKNEIKRLAENQMEMNSAFAKRLDRIDNRVTNLERPKKVVANKKRRLK